MRAKPSKYLAPALLAAAIPATVVLAQQAQPQPAEPQKREWANRPRLSPEALKLNDAQLKLWAPVEQQLRAGFTARQQAREEFMQRMEQRRQQGGAAERSSLPERLDRISKRMTERAQRMQAFTEAFKPFYAALSEEQKAVAGVVLSDMRGGMHGPGRRWAERGP